MTKDPLAGRDPQAVSALAFCAFTLGGCAYVVGSKALGLGPAAVTLVPVAVIALYAATALFAAGGRLRDAQTGDNVYYMGFLFTLASLGTALYQFSASGGAEAVVRNFGIALSSTIAGVAGRVVISQLRHEPAEVERTARLELADAARRFRRELDAALVETQVHRRAADQAQRDAFEEAGALVSAAAKAMVARLEAAGAEAERAVAEAGRRNAEAPAARRTFVSLPEEPGPGREAAE
jgi:hypothetical protein